jgi:hypothetical protein
MEQAAHEELLAVLDAMERYGGGFVSALAVAWRKADPQNQAKLRTAFDNYYREYLVTARDNGQRARAARRSSADVEPRDPSGWEGGFADNH